MTLKKSIIIMVIAILGLCTQNGMAENMPIGTWTIYPTYANPSQKVIETDNMVYFTTGNRLFSYDKKNEETRALTTSNILNDSNVSNIFYNFDKKLLVVCYDNGNIDLLYDDGSVVNMSDIKDSSINPPLTINYVCFDGDFMFAATDFGLVKFNIKRAEVVTSGNYGKKINAVAVMGDRLVIHSEEHFRYIDKNRLLSRYEDFTEIYNHNAPLDIVAIDENNMLVRLSHPQYTLAIHTVDFEKGSLKKWNILTSKYSSLPPYLSFDKEGHIFYVADNALYTINDQQKEQKLANLPEPLQDSKIGTLTGIGSVWSLNNQGLANYTLDGEGGMTVNIDRFKADGFPVTKVRYFFPSADGKRLYAQNSGITSYKFGGATRGLENAQTAGYVDLSTGDLIDVTTYPVEATVSIVQNYQRTYGKYFLSPVALAEDPNDQSVIFVATADDGLYKIRDGEIVGRYGHLNAPMAFVDNRDIFYYAAFDNHGNLWTVVNHKSWTKEPIMILPADKVKLDPAQVTAEDWIVPDMKSVDFWGGQDCRMLFCKKSNNIILLTAGGDFCLAYNDRGTSSNFNDDTFRLWEKVTDQDGKESTAKFFGSVIEDLNGKIWIGTNEGIYEMNPSNLYNPNAKFTHLKVPRNDGSNLADYLLGTDMVIDMSVDAANRKWIATTKSGLFLVNAAGNEILANFTAENSPLPTNVINCVYADKATGVVYIGTDYGLISYSSDATPAKDNYDDILVYPNPVKPEYRGDVQIIGLMDNSLVKIADVSGNVVYQGRSEGGRFSWNCCNSAGVRVKTGVYYVLASQNATGSASGAVAKIMVVN